MSTTHPRTALATTVRIGRRPIHDRALEVVAYELVPDGGRTAAVGDQLLGDLVDVGLERLSSGRPLVVTLPDALVREGGLAHLPLDRLVVEVTADHGGDEVVEAVLAGARRDGLRLQVADPVAHPHLAAIAEHADVVAVDVTGMDPGARRVRVAELRGRAALLARGVDDHATHADCRSAGFELFTGQVLSTPRVVSGMRLGGDHVALLRLIALLDDPDSRVDALEAAVTTSPALSYQLLRYVNSAHVGLRTRVESVRHAVVLVGPPALRQLAGVLLAREASSRPEAIARIALTRAEACALVGTALGDGGSGHRTVGLLSAVDLLMDVPLDVALAELPLSTEVHDAVLHLTGRLGQVLRAVMRYECCDWDDPVLGRFDPAVLSDAFFTATRRADELLDRTRDL